MNIYRYLGKTFLCPRCGNKHTIGVRRIEKGNIEEIDGFIEKLVGKGKKILILSDNITWEVGGNRCNEIIKNSIPCILYPDNEKRVTAKEEYTHRILEKGKEADCILTVGTGTITDLGKYVGNILKIPVICFPTAASMNAYTSGVSSLISNGLKGVAIVKPAIGIFMDFDIISDAPVDLTKSGFADSLAKGYANADWRISSMITGENFCSLPFEIVSEAERKYMDKGARLLKKDKEIVEYLMEGLNIGGISMLIAGKSSPASGGEHLISHFLDMYVHLHGRENFSWHGIQVGIGILFSAFVYEYLQNLHKKDFERMFKSTKIDYQRRIEEIENRFLKGKRIVEKEFKKKFQSLKLLKEKLPSLWDTIKEEIKKFIYPYSTIKRYLKNAGCPLSFRKIGVSEELAYNSILSARYIRGRLTVLDIADELGIMKEITLKFLKNETFNSRT